MERNIVKLKLPLSRIMPNYEIDEIKKNVKSKYKNWKFGECYAVFTVFKKRKNK